jgi:hypothetical protein
MMPIGANVKVVQFLHLKLLKLISCDYKSLQNNIHVNIYVAVNLMIDGPDISGTG